MGYPFLLGQPVPLSIYHITFVDLEWRKVKDKGHLYLIYMTKALKMLYHENIKDVMHKTQGVNNNGLPHRLYDDQIDNRGMSTLSITTETVTNMLNCRDTVFMLLCSCDPVAFN